MLQVLTTMLPVFLLWLCFRDSPFHAGVPVRAVYVCLICHCLHSNTPNTLPKGIQCSFFALYICPHFRGDFHHFHVITTVLHQWPLCQVFDVGCALSSLLWRPFQQELYQLVFLWRAEGSRSHAPHGRISNKTLCPSMSCKSKGAEAVTWIQGGTVYISLGSISHLKLTAFSKETIAITAKRCVNHRNVNKQQLLVCCCFKLETVIQRFFYPVAVSNRV